MGADGQARLAQHRAALDRPEQCFGVDPATVVAVRGVECNSGQTFGKYPLVQALGTLGGVSGTGAGAAPVANQLPLSYTLVAQRAPRRPGPWGPPA